MQHQTYDDGQINTTLVRHLFEGVAVDDEEEDNELGVRRPGTEEGGGGSGGGGGGAGGSGGGGGGGASGVGPDENGSGSEGEGTSGDEEEEAAFAAAAAAAAATARQTMPMTPTRAGVGRAELTKPYHMPRHQPRLKPWFIALSEGNPPCDAAGIVR